MNGAERALLAALLATALRRPVGAVLLRLLTGAADDPALYYAGVVLEECLLWAAAMLFMRPGRGGGLRPDARWGAGCVAAVLAGAAAQAVTAFLAPYWTAFIGAEGAAMLMPRNGAEWLLAALALVVAPAVAEETFYRGGLMNRLTECMGAPAAFFLTAAVFALSHGSLAGLPAHLTISLLCSLAYLRYGRLTVSVLTHMGYNAAALFISVADIPAVLPALSAIGLAGVATAWAVDAPWRSPHGRMTGRAALLTTLLLLAAGVQLSA